MKNFYKEHPLVELSTKQTALIRAIYASFVAYILPWGFIYYLQGNNPVVVEMGIFEVSYSYLMAALFGIIYLGEILFLVPWLKWRFQRPLYLRKYGQPGEAICQSVESHTIFDRVYKLQIRFVLGGVIFSKTVSRDKDASKQDSLEAEYYFSLQEGDRVPVVYNPHDPSDFLLDLKPNAPS